MGLGSLPDLVHLRLSYNALIGEPPRELANLKRLQLLHLHGNRLQGSIPPSLNVVVQSNHSSFISDCGVPSAFVAPLECFHCTMCCNSNGDCEPAAQTMVQRGGFDNYQDFTPVFFVSVFGFCAVLALIAYLYREISRARARARARQQTNFSRRGQSVRASTIQRDKFLALDTIGDDSVYQFLLGNSKQGWAIALSTVALQIWVLFVFVRGAEVNLSDDRSDKAFTWLCPRDKITCEDTSDLTAEGWAVFGFVMVAHLLKDFINGAKMVLMSTRQGHSWRRQVRFFVGGLVLAMVTLFTLFVTWIYNLAIASELGLILIR